MMFKMDENLPIDIADLLRQEGYDALSVMDQDVAGHPDADVAALCQREQRAIVTLAFEVLFGRFVIGASWERLAADYKVLEGGLLPFGMLVLLLSPLIAAKVRGLTS